MAIGNNFEAALLKELFLGNRSVFLNKNHLQRNLDELKQRVQVPDDERILI